MEISSEKSETMSLLGQDTVTCKIVVANKCLQVKNFQYLGYDIYYEYEKDIQQKLAKFAQILGIMNNNFKPNFVHKFLKIKVHNALAPPLPPPF